jgi:formylglycine-generating enzyme required for sulfatase activity
MPTTTVSGKRSRNSRIAIENLESGVVAAAAMTVKPPGSAIIDSANDPTGNRSGTSVWAGTSAPAAGVCDIIRGIACNQHSYQYWPSWFGVSIAGPVKSLMKGHGMRNFVIGCIVLFTMAGTAFSETKGLPKKFAVDLGGGVKMELVLIPAGEFLMGSPDSDKRAIPNEKPQHRVRITKPFYLGKFLVTQEQWAAVMGNNPSHFKGPKNPVEQVSWDDCQKFLEKLNAKIGTQRGKLVLPTEAYWEYACRAGSTTRYCFGDDESGLGEYAWYGSNSDNKTHPVGEKKPNAWGLYDMHGNVWEWCADWGDWDDGRYHANSPTDDPTGPATGSYRVFRGGSWKYPTRDCRSAIRFRDEPEDRYYDLGFRVSQVPADR